MRPGTHFQVYSGCWCKESVQCGSSLGQEGPAESWLLVSGAGVRERASECGEAPLPPVDVS